MRTNKVEVHGLIFAGCAVASFVILTDPILFMLSMLFSFFWEDNKWPAFDASNYDDKMRLLKPWDKGY